LPKAIFWLKRAIISNSPKKAAEGSRKIRVIRVIRVPKKIRVIRVPNPNPCSKKIRVPHSRSPAQISDKIPGFRPCFFADNALGVVSGLSFPKSRFQAVIMRLLNANHTDLISRYHEP
jgi:hypothetical protein